MSFRSKVVACLMLGLAIGLETARGQGKTQAKGKSEASRPSHITVMSADGRSKEVVFTAPGNFQAPNWSPDGSYLLLNGGGKIYRMPVGGAEPRLIETGALKGINNDHGIAPDGKSLAVSAGQIYLVPPEGGEPRQVTRQVPSYFHGWSPDGKTLAYCAKRGDNFDLYDIPVGGGDERRLTTHAGYDDGPDYSPDGRWIYFNSDRSGSWDIWRIPADGAGPDDAKCERITSDDYEDWFPHPSPDGKWMVFLSFAQGTKGHPANQEVVLRIIPLPGDRHVPDASRELARLFGGQGTMNVNSWSPDSKRFAYVSYDRPTVDSP
jgi:TolB protein